MKTNFTIVQASDGKTPRLSLITTGEHIAMIFEVEADARAHLATLDDADDLTVAPIRRHSIIPWIIQSGVKRVREQRKDGDGEVFDIPSYERFLKSQDTPPAS